MHLSLIHIFNEREQKIIVLRYGLDGKEAMTQKSVAKMLGMKNVRPRSRKHKKATGIFNKIVVSPMGTPNSR